jgi:hypothetical protein
MYSGLAHRARLTSLKRLSVAYSQVGDAGLAHFSGLSRLEMLGQKNCRIAGARRARALLDTTSGWSQRVLAEWERADDEVRAALECVLAEFERKTRDRILSAFRYGGLVVNRCPRCRWVVRTPLARQCLWCGHDWHS